ncbi:MAG: M67 family metallopeptidase [Anaerolineae bacterium]|nr:M67 family metallopeptidase [Anaerolineae bacterium]
MRLWLTHDQVRQLVDLANITSPREACGLLVGDAERVTRIIALPNTASDSQHNYHIDDQALTKTLFQLQREGLRLHAFFHSHPRSRPIPSDTDKQQATYADVPYLIVGLHPAPQISAWLLTRAEATPVEIHIGDNRPPALPAPMSPAQKRAIIAAALIAFLVVIALSLSLLPPAPVIVTP